jgi:hypothetical protein
LYFYLTFLIAAVYSSTTTHYVSAKTSETCTETKKPGGIIVSTCCDITTNDKGVVTKVECITTVCQFPDGLCHVGKADLNEKTTNPNILNDNNVLQGSNNNDNNTSDDNVKEPKARKYLKTLEA